MDSQTARPEGTTMRPRATLVSLVVCLLFLSTSAFGQQTIVSANRSIDWSQAGIPGGIPNRTVHCAVLNPGATAAQITNAISACPSGQVVFLNAGTYNLNGGIVFNNKSNVTLRGAGADQTFLVFSAGDSCGGEGGNVCFINSDANWTGDPRNVANWTGGYAKGSTSVTLSSTANLKVGSILILDQLNDSNIDNGVIWVCGTGGVCAVQGESGHGRPGRYQQQLTRVTAISGTTVSISPAIYMPNWRTSQSPGAWWSNATPIVLSGIENLSIDNGGSSATAGIKMYNAYNCWAKGVRSLRGRRSHVLLYQATNNVIRDSYFYGTLNAASQSYGIEHFQASANLIENNIFQHITAPMMNVGATGSVFAYNYSTDDYYLTADWMQASSYHHAPGVSFLLWEGNDGAGLTADQVHGTSHFVTAFRNRFNGWEPGKSLQTVAVHIYTFNRYFNIIGNVLGTDAYHNTYASQAGGSSSNCDKSIYALGWGGNCGSGSLPNDTKVASTLVRWGNYDTVNDAARFLAAEVPSGDANYPNPVPSDNTLPSSFYLSAKPSFFGTTPWPAIGPDVTGGQDSSVGGRAYKIPARACFESSASVNGILTFKPAVCYPNSGSATPPAAPTNLRIVG
jgi:hypothetical protein